MTRTALIDGDVLFYLYAFPYEYKVEWEEDFQTTITFPVQAKDRLDRFVDTLKKATKSEDAVIFYSNDESNFRYGILPTYKASRDDSKRPELHGVLRQHVKDTYVTECWPGVEADDALGVTGSQHPDTTVVCTIDKDLYTIPCHLYNWNQMGKPRRNTLEYANWFWMYQTLMGDSVDEYKGCPMIGKKKAADILGLPGERSLEEMWELVVATYERVTKKQAMKANGKEELTVDDAIVQAQVARILRVEDWDFNKEKPIIWTP